MGNVISEVTGHMMFEKSSGTVSSDKSELSKFLEIGKSEFMEGCAVADARSVELMTEGRIVKFKTPFVLFCIPVLVILILLGLIHGWLFSGVKCDNDSISRCRGLIKKIWIFSYKNRLDCI